MAEEWETDIDDALAGFDDEPADDELEDVLGGFDAEDEGSNEADDVDDVLSGFDDDDSTSEGSGDTAPADRWWATSGSVSLGASYNLREHFSSTGTDYSGLQRFRARMDFQFDADLPARWDLRLQAYGFYDMAYVINGRENYTQPVLDHYEHELEILDLYVEGTLLPGLDLKLGRQVVNWGRSDTLRVNDVLNPLDNREPALADIESLRLPVTMAKADYYLGDWKFTAIVIPEARYDRNPPLGSDFFPAFSFDDLAPFPGRDEWLIFDLLGGAIDAGVELPDRSESQWGGTPEFAGAIGGIFSGWDITFYASRTFQNRTSTVINLPGGGGLPSLFLDDDQVTQVGAGGNLTLGSWLLKAELAYLIDLDYSMPVPDPSRCPDGPLVPDCLPYDVVQLQTGRIDSMGGIEYYGWTDWTVAVELAHRHLVDYDPLLRYLPNYLDENSVELAVRVGRDMMNQRLTLTGLVVGLFSEKGHIGSTIRLSAAYDVMDGVTIDGGLLYFVGSERVPFDTWQDNDRIFAKVKYSY